MRLHNGLDDRETYPGAAPRGSTAEALEDIGQFLIRDTRPVVTHFDNDALPVWVRTELDPSAVFGVANGVLDQAIERSLQWRFAAGRQRVTVRSSSALRGTTEGFTVQCSSIRARVSRRAAIRSRLSNSSSTTIAS